VAGRMHEDEIEVSDRLVRQLVASQMPDLSDLDIHRLDSVGTVNAIFRLGPELCVRLPIKPGCADDLGREVVWLDRLRPQLPLDIPEPVATGSPGLGYPFRWAVYRWLEGTPYSEELVEDETQAAQDLAGFVRALQQIATSGAPSSGRLPLRELDAATRWAIERMDEVDRSTQITDAWEHLLATPPWEGTAVWRHCDLLPSNLLVDEGRLSAVIDFGGVGVGDPAADLIPAWTVFGSHGRLVFREVLDPDEAAWDRAMGLALHQAALIIPYYSASNPAFAAMARRTVRQVLSDLDLC
jgi:aminoglycoside phosphotransferase (APT) family kinase protein